MYQRNVFDYFLASARRLPDKPALCDEKESDTFAQLLDKALRVGSFLHRRYGSINRPVAVGVERSVKSFACLQGVLACGNYYVPVDLTMPRERMERVFQQLRPLCFLCPAEQREKLLPLEKLCPLEDMDAALAEKPEEEAVLAALRSRVLDVDPAYVLFTSGSTGLPKGIAVTHRGLMDFTEWLAEIEDCTEQDVFANQSPFYFDTSVKDMYLTLKCGATTHILSKKLFLFPKLLMDSLWEKQVTTLHWATSAFHLVAASGVLEKRVPETLRTVVMGGEALQAKQLNRWRRALPRVRYINMYGPTEVTVDCAYYPIEREFSDQETIPIGRACANMEVFLLDEQLRPVPDGTPGEICVRGGGLAKGYIGEWGKTRSAFIQDPRNPDYPDRIYRTGDLGVINETGDLIFLSRLDSQIKHMGYRIELGEIETALAAISSVEEAVCLFDREKDRILCVYAGGEEPAALECALLSRLPKYMLPNEYYRLEEGLPHNANGKLDRQNLKARYLHGTGHGI